MDLREDLKQQEDRIQRLPARKRKRLREAVNLERKMLELQSQIRALADAQSNVMASFSYLEKCMVKRHALLELLINENQDKR